jgi:hypothetical protein
LHGEHLEWVIEAIKKESDMWHCHTPTADAIVITTVKACLTLRQHFTCAARLWVKTINILMVPFRRIVAKDRYHLKAKWKKLGKLPRNPGFPPKRLRREFEIFMSTILICVIAVDNPLALAYLFDHLYVHSGRGA